MILKKELQRRVDVILGMEKEEIPSGISDEACYEIAAGNEMLETCQNILNGKDYD